MKTPALFLSLLLLLSACNERHGDDNRQMQAGGTLSPAASPGRQSPAPTPAP